MPAAFEDNLSSCRSSPLHWKPVPVPAPVFDGFPSDLSAGEEINSWEQCMRILNSSRNGNSRFSCLEVMDDDLYVAASIHGPPSSRSASMRSFSSSKNFQRSSSAYPVFGSTGSERMRRSSTAMNRYHVQSPEREAVPQNQSQATRAKDEELAEVKVEELAVTIRNNSTSMKSARMGSSISRVTWNSPTLQSEYSDFPTNRDFESIDEHQQQHSHEHSGSILKRIFQLGGKNRLSRSLSTTSSISHSRGGLPSDCRSKERGCFGGKVWMKRRKSPRPRLSSADLGDVDPRVSSTNLTNDGISSACGDEEGSVFGRNMMRWLQYQQLLAMATRAQNNLTELATMLQYAVKSLDDMKEMDDVAHEMHQKRNRCYYAS